MLCWPVLAVKVRPAVSLIEKDPPAGQQSHPTIMTSEGFAVVRVTEQEVTYPHPFFALPSSDGGVREPVELVVVVLDDVDVVPGCRASVTAPKSLPCDVPNEIVADERGLEAIPYCA
jgi:hypothetical protein